MRNSKKAAVTRYLSTIEGKNFVITNLVAEIANSYYELLALDNQLEIVTANYRVAKKCSGNCKDAEGGCTDHGIGRSKI